MIQVRIPKVGIVNFPDGMRPEEIEREAYKLYLDAIGPLNISTVYDPNRAVLTGRPPIESYNVPTPAPAAEIPEIFNLAPGFEQRLAKGPIGPGEAPFEIGSALLTGSDIGGRLERQALTGKPEAETGNVFTDILMETATDPIVQASFFTAAPIVAARSGLRRLLKAGIKKVAKPSEAADALKAFIKGRIKEGISPKTIELNLDIKPLSGEKYAPGSAINLNRLDIPDAAKQKIEASVNAVKPELEKMKGDTLTNQEVIDAAAASDALQNVTNRKRTLEAAATMHKARQELARMAQDPGVTKEFIETLRVVSAEATERGRLLQALSIEAQPFTADTVKIQLVKKLNEIGIKADDIVKAAEGIDFSNQKEVEKFYRTFVKPTVPELLDEYRYINLLSSPKTHIVNAFSNLTQAAFLAPSTKLASGLVDTIASSLTGRAREHYLREVPIYYRGLINSIPKAIDDAARALRGETILGRPDVARIGTGAKWLAPGKIITRGLEAGDVFFRTLVETGEKAALTAKYAQQGVSKSADEIAEEAAEKAQYYIFRSALDPKNEKGQGHVLSVLDYLTAGIYNFRNDFVFKKITIPNPLKWFVPFVQTPMNIVKQGIEYSPAGLLTLPGAQNKVEQLGKTLVGTSVFAGAGYLALNDRTTWKAPTNEKDRAQFYASGRKPYSLKIGDQWVSYSRLGPLAYPIALASAMKWYAEENPESVGQSELEKTGRLVAGMGQFFSDQSYLQGIGDFIGAVEDPYRLGQAMTNLPNQVIPLSSLQRWVGNIIDPVYRKPEKGLSLQAIYQNLIATNPWMRQQLETYETPTGEPSERKYPLLNAWLPIDITPAEQDEEGRYQEIQQIRRISAQYRKEQEQEKEEANLTRDLIVDQLKGLSPKDAVEQIQSLDIDKKLMVSVFEKLYPEDIVTQILKSSPVTVRARYMDGKLEGMSPQEQAKYLAARIKDGTINEGNILRLILEMPSMKQILLNTWKEKYQSQ